MATIERELGAKRRTGESDMKRTYAVALALAAVVGWISLFPVHAAPPTATPSPGYDARLQEQRAAAAATVYEPAVPVAKPAARHRSKRTHVH
jgi:hypothetical protein